MFLVVVNTPDEGRSELGPFNTYQEAQWRAQYERECALYIWGNEARADIGTRVEYVR